MRVLGVAQTRSDGPPWPETPQGFNLHWLGLVGLADPIRPTVAEAVRECRQAGIRVVMITGDYPATAEAIARQAGLADGQMLSGPQLAALDDAALAAVLADTGVFARILPEQKLRLVQAFKARGDVVAMTGDGVNDAPALKAAHIGISMGERGTDVAREASSLVLLNDDFTSIVRAIRLGRRIYDNLRKALSYVVAVHLPIAGMTLLPLLFGLPPAFAPVHIVFLEMIINPACAIVFEAEAPERDIMQRPPRQLAERLFGARHVGLSVLQGLGLLAVVAVVYFQALAGGLQEGQASMLAFTTLVVGNLGLILSSRSLSLGALALLRTPNPAPWWMRGLGSAALLAVSTLPFLQQVFHFEPVPATASAKAVGAGGLALLWFEAVKYGFRHRA
jgi:Ca2+-transporting ATPase